MASDSYWLKRQDKVTGPYALAQIQAGIRSGKILQTDELSKSQAGPWKTVASASGNRSSSTTAPQQARSDSPRDKPSGSTGTTAQPQPARAASQSNIDPHVGLEREYGHWTCPRCESHDAYEGTAQEYRPGVTVMREAGDTGMYFGASSGRYHLVSQVKCRNCSEELYADQHYTKTLYEMALEGARRIWAIKIALPISAMLLAGVIWGAYAWVVPLCRASDAFSPERQDDKFVLNQKATAEMHIAEARDMAAQNGAGDAAAAKALKKAANAYVDAWMFEEAVPLYEQVIPILTKALGTDDAETKETVQYLQSAKSKVIPWDPQRQPKKVEKKGGWGQEALFKLFLWPVSLIGCLLCCRLLIHVIEPYSPF